MKSMPVSVISAVSFLKRRFRLIRRAALLFVAIGLFSLTLLPPKDAQAQCGCVLFCGASHVLDALNTLIQLHADMIADFIEEFMEDLLAFQSWMTEKMVEGEFAPALAMMSVQMSAVAMQQMQVIGTFFDAEIQMDTDLLLQKMRIEAHKKYHPSDEMCWFGTNVRSLAVTEMRGQLNRVALSQYGIARQVGNANLNASRGVRQDQAGRWQQFAKTYCDIRDNNWMRAGGGLELACDHDGIAGGDTGGDDPNRLNRDLDYGRLIEQPRTLEVDFEEAGDLTDDEEDVIALGSNLYGHDVLSRDIARFGAKLESGQNLYMALRSIAAKRAVAQDSYNAIVGLKARGGEMPEDPPEADTRQYLAAIIKELMPLDTPDEDIYAYIGERPSYYAQLEILAKKIYQNTDFYAYLYESPENVERKHVAMQAIELMLDREIFESQLRREMAVSVMLSSKLRSAFRDANKSGLTGTGSKE